MPSRTLETTATLLEAGRLPLLQLAEFAKREGRRPRPIYSGHKWFARRLGVIFRSLLVAANLEPDEDFWDAYYGSGDLCGKTVLDPFVGGGTSVVEASRLGANCIGVDIDPVACAVTGFESVAHEMPDLSESLDLLKGKVGARLARYHRKQLPSGETMTVLHHFWVQEVACPSCSRTVYGHPNFILAEDKQWCWSFCRACGSIGRRRSGIARAKCSECGTRTSIREGYVHKGKLSCPHCSHREALIDIARSSGVPPRCPWKRVAICCCAVHRPVVARLNFLLDRELTEP